MAFCENCKHLFKYAGVDNYYCDVQDNEDKKDTWLKKKTKNGPEEINKNNDCPDYDAR